MISVCQMGETEVSLDFHYGGMGVPPKAVVLWSSGGSDGPRRERPPGALAWGTVFSIELGVAPCCGSTVTRDQTSICCIGPEGRRRILS